MAYDLRKAAISVLQNGWLCACGSICVRCAECDAARLLKAAGFDVSEPEAETADKRSVYVVTEKTTD